MLNIALGWDPRELVGFEIAKFSIMRRSSVPVRFHPIMQKVVRRTGLYWRPEEMRGNQRWDVISDAPCATEFSITRFLTPHLTAGSQWSLFMDCDMLCLDDIANLFALADDQYAVMCVQHSHNPPEGLKMDGQQQVQYARKNWSSVMLFNNDHPSNAKLTLDLINEVPGRDLHRFCWLADHEIGALPLQWNWLEGEEPYPGLPSLVHFTRGTPDMPGYENVKYADKWRAEEAVMNAWNRPVRAA